MKSSEQTEASKHTTKCLLFRWNVHKWTLWVGEWGGIQLNLEHPKLQTSGTLNNTFQKDLSSPRLRQSYSLGSLFSVLLTDWQHLIFSKLLLPSQRRSELQREH